MNNLIKLKVFIVTLFIIISSNSIAGERILPLSKPSVDLETKKSVAKKKEIYPKKKPLDTKEKKQVDTTNETVNISENNDVEDLIYPKKKPIVVKKVVEKSILKSNILSKKDFDIAKA